MKGDFSRFTFDAKKHFSAVRMQQGRVQLDADWNEQLDISQHRLAMQMSDFIGYSGVPVGQEKSFEITPGQNDNKVIKIGKGRIYIAGQLYENEAQVDFTAQADYPGAKLPTESGTYVAYLDVWQRHITPLEDPSLLEVALGGPDTTTRVKNVWQVKLSKESYTPSDDWKPKAVDPISTGQMKAKVEEGAVLENQLYRVEIHQGGEASEATFKWSRDNGAVAARVEAIDSKTKTKTKTKTITISISSAGRDPEMGFSANQWIELRSEEQTLKGEPGTLYQLTRVQGNKLIVEIKEENGIKSPPLPTYDKKKGWLVRRWDSQKEVKISPADWHPLENKIQVQFKNEGVYKTGDYWLIPARHLTGKIDWPTADNKPRFQPPHGILHHYAPLAELTYNGQWSVLKDLRTKFSSLIGGFVGKTGDNTIDGSLTIKAENKNALTVRGNTELNGSLTVKGNVGIGIDPTADGSKLLIKGDIQFGPQGQFYPVASQKKWNVVVGSVDENGNKKGVSSYFSCSKKNKIYNITIMSIDNSTVFIVVQTSFSNIIVNKIDKNKEGIDLCFTSISSIGEYASASFDFIAVY